MANHKSADKRHRQSLKRRDSNRVAKSTIRTTVKKIHSFVEKGEHSEAQALARKASGLIDKAAVHGVIHKKNAQRSISRINRFVSSSSSAA